MITVPRSVQTVLILSITFTVNFILYQIQNSLTTRYGPRLVIITPTYNRTTQIAELVRMKQTLSLVPSCDWIIIEDAYEINPLVLKYIDDYQAGSLTYIATKSQDKIFRGMAQRNRALELIRSPNSPYLTHPEGAIYFGDDDNTYDARFLDSLRYTKGVSMFNVGLSANSTYEGPLVANNKIIGFVTPFYGDRKYCIDMAGFAINLKLMLNTPSARFLSTQRGRMESEFLDKFNLPLEQFEYFHGSQGIHVWHTQTKEVTNRKPHLRVYPGNGTVLDVRPQEVKDQERREQERIRAENQRKKKLLAEKREKEAAAKEAAAKAAKAKAEAEAAAKAAQANEPPPVGNKPPAAPQPPVNPPPNVPKPPPGPVQPAAKT